MSTTEPHHLTLEEKAGLLSGRDFWSTRPVERAGVPSIVLTDGPHGVRRQMGADDHLGLNSSHPATCFPPAVAVGSSWDPTVAERIGEAVGREARRLGVHIALGPGVNIKRSPLCGRNFEYYSEDPLLSGVLGAAHVRGQQSTGTGASVKHFAANNQETERMRISAEVDERTLREIYLPAFERVVKDASPATVMCAYNKVNGVYAAENRWLLTDVLREEWGFAGVVVSDWGAVQDPVASVRAGLDLEMPGVGTGSVSRILAALDAGELDHEAVDTAVARVLALTAQVSERSGTETDVDLDAHHALARKLATDCAVLLKNERDALPLPDGANIAVIGAFAATPRFQGGGSSRVNATRVDTPLDALGALAPERGCTISFAPGFTLDDGGPAEDGQALRQEAVEAARAADVAVVFAGLAESDESEGFDRSDLDLPRSQVEVIRAVADTAARTVVVLSNGGVVSLEDWHDDVDAILEGFLLGQAGGSALADLLFAVANPSGRLAETIPAQLADTASHVNFPGEQGHVRYGEGVMVGYRWHEATGRPARYPFGHGLSYTTFEVRDLGVDVTGPDSARATVTVTNTGDRAGRHVVQVYVATHTGPVRRPVRELRAFSKVHLEPGESHYLTFDLDRRAFAYWDVTHAGWVVRAGTYAVQIGQDAATVISERSFTLAGDDITEELTLQSTVEEWSSHPVVGADVRAALAAQSSAGSGTQLTPGLLRIISSMPMQKVVDLLGGAAGITTALESLMERTRGQRATQLTGESEAS